MRENVYVDRLFAGYEDTPEIRDFKEEIAANLKERIRALVAGGLDEGAAFDKATAELGDVMAIADDVGKKKRNEAIGRMYMSARVPLTTKTAAGITAATGALLLAVGLSLIALFSGADYAFAFYNISVVLLAVSCGLYVFFGLTQETASHYAMKRGRALAYGVVFAAALLGAGLAVVVFLGGGFELALAVGFKTAFILPAICALIFLGATGKTRQKPWLKAMVERDIENSMSFHHDMVDPVRAARFGVASGGLWLLAISVFLALGFLLSWQYSWLVFPFALAIQVFMTATIFVKRK